MKIQILCFVLFLSIIGLTGENKAHAGGGELLLAPFTHINTTPLSPAVSVTRGHKDIVVLKEAGTIAYRVRCYPIKNVDVYRELKEADLTTTLAIADSTASKVFETYSWCEQIKISVTSCSSCFYSLFIRAYE